MVEVIAHRVTPTGCLEARKRYAQAVGLFITSVFWGGETIHLKRTPAEACFIGDDKKKKKDGGMCQCIRE